MINKYIRVDNKILSIYQTVHLISEGRINIFSNNNIRWPTENGSALMESILLGVPIQSFYLFEEDDGHMDVFSGSQCLSSIYSFINNEFSLYGLCFFKELEGKRFNEIGLKFTRRIEDTELTFHILSGKYRDIVLNDLLEKIL